MYSSVDKCLVAIAMAAIYLLNRFAGINIGIDEATVTTAVAVLTPILVYLVPNRPPA